MAVSLCIFNLISSWALGGKQQFMGVLEREPLIIVFINGAVYALGDYLEMASLGGLPSAAYQILQQIRIVLIALLLIPSKNQYQTRLQWTLLFILMFGMSTHLCISTSGKDNVDSSRSDGALHVDISEFQTHLASLHMSCILIFMWYLGTMSHSYASTSMALDLASRQLAAQTATMRGTTIRSAVALLLQTRALRLACTSQ